MKEKITFKDLSRWLKFGAVVSIGLGIVYLALISIIFIRMFF